MFKRRSPTDPFISNWVERLKQLTRIKEKYGGGGSSIGGQSFLRSQSVDPRLDAVGGSVTPGSVSIASMVSTTGNSSRNASRADDQRFRSSSTISDLNKQLHDGGLTLKEPKPDAGHDGGGGGHHRNISREQSRVADDFTSYT